ncbi:putative choline transporter, neither null mutation nor overexpression affects choline transport [Serendipita sp. 399]|nr:putative choline transporter, neither null mutation nor overexpression affects choline transport [Serendipita sp. 399]
MLRLEGHPGPPPAQFSQQQAKYPPNNGSSHEKDHEHYGEPQRFKPKKKWNDLPFLIFYILTVAGFATVSGLALYSWVKNNGGGGGLGGNRTGNSNILNSSTVYLLLLITALSMLLTILYMLLLRAFPKPILHVSLILTPFGALAVAAYYFYVKYYSGAIIFLIFVILFAFVYLGYRKRVPMAAMFLRIVLDIAKHHKLGVYGTALIAILVQAGLGVWFVFTIVATYLRWGNAACRAGSAANPTSNTSCKPYIKAAKDTWNLITDRGVDAIINDTIVALAMTWASFFIGLLCVLFGYIYLRATKPAYNSDGSYTPAILVYSWFVGFQVAQSLTAAIDAGVSTIFVGLAEHPEVLKQRAPALFGLIEQDYPRVVHGIHGTV